MASKLIRINALVLTVGSLMACGAKAVPLKGSFEAEKECPLYSSVKKQKNPGRFFTKKGAKYEVSQRNKRGGKYLRVLVAKAKPKTRWVDESCGQFMFPGQSKAAAKAKASASASASVSTGGTKASANTTIRPTLSLNRSNSSNTSVKKPTNQVANKRFKPFFDDKDTGYKDMTPRAPVVSAFDRAVLDVCGKWGSHPNSADFRVMLNRPEHQATVETIKSRLNGFVIKRKPSDKQFKDELTAVWFGRDGFAHIFCGEPGYKLGGLHFAPRYLEMQQKDWGGIMSARECRPEIKKGAIYSIGVAYQSRNGDKKHCIKGYGLTLNAVDTLVYGVKGLRAMGRKATNNKNVCLYKVTDDGKSFWNVLVVKRGGIRTFYPDASPRCDRGKPERCACKK